MESPPPVTGSGLCGEDEMKDTTVLCGANFYEQKYYFNQISNPCPVHRVSSRSCVMYTEDVGGVLTMEFDEGSGIQGDLGETDYLFDEIGSVLKIKQYQEEKEKKCWKRWKELYYRTFFLGEDIDIG